MCAGSEFQVDGAETENARDVKLLRQSSDRDPSDPLLNWPVSDPRDRWPMTLRVIIIVYRLHAHLHQHVDVQTTENLRAQAEAPICPPNLTTLQYYPLPRFFVGKLAIRLSVPCNCALKLYTVSQKTSHLWLAITLTYVSGFWCFSADVLPIK